jgi:hypothetical protein
MVNWHCMMIACLQQLNQKKTKRVCKEVIKLKKLFDLHFSKGELHNQ